jgi:signal transduction histidine kinase
MVPDYHDNRKQALRDLSLVVLTFAITFCISAYFDLSEFIVEWTEQTEDHYNFDEIPHSLLVSAVTLCWFAWRRWKDANREIDRRKATELALDNERRHFQTLFNENLAGNAVATPEGIIQMCNPAFASFLEVGSLQHAVGCNLADYFRNESYWANLVASIQISYTGEADIVGLYGRRTRVILRAVGQFDQSHTLQSIHIFAADVTELKLAESEISVLLHENNYLLRHALDLQEDERRNIARDLHDDLGQYLNAIKADTTSILRSEGIHDDIQTLAKRIVSHSDHIYRSARQIMYRLRPVALDELGLTAALHHLINTWKQPDRETSYELHVSEGVDQVSEHIAINTYRIIQEALTNASKYAKASMVIVEVLQKEAHLQVNIKDNGIGIDIRKPGKGMGIVGMRERIKSIGGKFEISSHHGSGVTIRASIPLKQAVEESM